MECGFNQPSGFKDFQTTESLRDIGPRSVNDLKLPITTVVVCFVICL